MSIDQIFEIRSLDALAKLLQALPPRRTQQQLTKLLFENVPYRNVTQWNRVVRVCEALTIVGWGELEPVQAVRDKYYNGFPWTMLVNRCGERRYVEAMWSKRRDGYLMVEDSVILHGSDDLPGTLSQQDVMTTGEPQNEVLATQQNWISRSPIRIGQTVVNCYDSSKDFVITVAKLRDKLLHEMRPEVYGRAIDQLCFYFHTSYRGPGCATNFVIQSDDKLLNDGDRQRQLRKLYSADEIKTMGYQLVPRYLFRPFRAVAGQMNISIHLTKEFSEQTTRSQRLEFADLLSTAIDEVVTKLRKKRLLYDLDTMRIDAAKIIQAWAMNSTNKRLNVSGGPRPT